MIHTICAGEICIIETDDGLEFATQAKNRRENRRGKDGLNVNVITDANLDKFIDKLVTIKAARSYEKYMNQKLA